MKKTIKKIKKRAKKVTRHHHFYPSLAMLFALLSMGIAVTTRISVHADDMILKSPADTVTNTSISCSYSYSDWSECNSSGKQTRTVVSKSPLGCVAKDNPNIEQSCKYTPPSPISCSYSYSDWSECNSSGKQTRTVVSKSPSGCEETITPDINRTCVYTAPQKIENINSGAIVSCSYSYSGWSSCASSGKKFRTVTVKSPSGCTEMIAPVLAQSCTYNSVSDTTKNTETSKNITTSSVDVSSQLNNNINEENNIAWQKLYFNSVDCATTDICSGAADPDNDGINNGDEYRYGTNPINPDTDQDGFTDGEEIKAGFNPSLKALTGERNDKVAFESPRNAGEIRSDIYKVENIVLIKNTQGNDRIKINGKGQPNSFVTIYIYSDPIVLTVKTDSDGNWSYELDNTLEDGNHEIYVAITDNTGKIKEKSVPLAFIKTAEAITTIPLAAEDTARDRAASPTQNLYKNDILFFIAIGFGGLALALAAIGFLKYNFHKRNENERGD